MIHRLLLVLVLLLVGSGDACASRRVKLVDLRDQPVPAAAGQAADLAQLEQSWRRALAAHQWEVKSSTPGRIHATTTVRSKHFVEIDIRYTVATYSILYVNSVNLNYRIDKKGTRIHPNYMKWVRWLADSFEQDLLLPR